MARRFTLALQGSPRIEKSLPRREASLGHDYGHPRLLETRTFKTQLRNITSHNPNCLLVLVMALFHSMYGQIIIFVACISSG